MLRMGRYCRRLLPWLFTSQAAVFLGILVFSEPLLLQKPCPSRRTTEEGGRRQSSSRVAEFSQTAHRDVAVDCAAIFNNDADAIAAASDNKWCVRADVISEADYVTLTRDCNAFIQSHGYRSHPVTDEEAAFPLAFSLLLYEEVEQAERLLRAIYRPQNFYCLHVDAKASARVRHAVQTIADCFSNVQVASRLVVVSWAEFSVLEADLVCMEDLLRHPEWKYFINLTGRDFPIRTNWELVQILKAYNGANDIDGSLNRRPQTWTQYVWRREYWRSNKLNPPPPHRFQIAKGSVHIAATRAFVHFAVHNQTAKDLMEWTRNIRVPDEHFFATLNHNPQLGVPGAYTQNPDQRGEFILRLKIWQNAKNFCHGKWRRYICQFGLGDLPQIPTAKHLFVNKFDLSFDPVAFLCMEEWYSNRTRTDNDFDVSYYSSRKLVKYHT